MRKWSSLPNQGRYPKALPGSPTLQGRHLHCNAGIFARNPTGKVRCSHLSKGHKERSFPSDAEDPESGRVDGTDEGITW